jgi:hypothetical protein
MKYKYELEGDLGISYQDEGPWRSYDVTEGYGNTEAEFLENINIAEIDQDGGELTCYGYEDAPGSVQKVIDAYLSRKARVEKTQHTPGPWTVAICTDLRPQVLGVNQLQIVRASGDPGMDHEANARLIAAAPEMLEVLERFYNLILYKEEPEIRHIPNDLYIALTGLLRKAKGDA